MPSDSLVLLLTQILAGASLLIMIYQVIASQRSRKRADSLLDQLEIGRREYRLMQYRATSNQALMEISSLFIGCNQDNLDEAVSNCLDIVGDFFEVDRASVYLIDYDSNSFSCINEWCRAGVSEQFDAQQSLRLESYPWLRKKLSDRQPVIINSLDCVPRSSTKLSAALRSAATQSLLMVPLISRDTVLGALRIETTYKARDWNDVEIEGVNMVAEILASELSHLQAEQAIRDNQRNFQNMLAYAPVAMVVINNKGVIQYAEGRALARAGFIASQLVGQHVDMAFKNDEVSKNFKQALAGDDCHSKIEIGQRHLEGHFTPVTGFNKEHSSVIITAIDTSDRAKLEERLAKEKLYNNVTGLPNKTLLLEKLLSSKELVANEICTSSYLLIISVNRTAPLHSALGTGAMHEMLRQISDRLVEFSGGDNLIAHISEYDFAFLADDISSDENALNIARDIQSLFEQPLFLESTQLNITCSIGIAQCDIRQENADEWVREAQTACVAASKDGGNTERVFHQNLASEALSSWQLSEQLKQALDDDKIEPWLQPIVNMETRKPIGFEALARWEISPGQFIPPGEFIPVAEEYGLIEELGNLMLRKSCKLLRRCHSADPKFSDLYISVNVASSQLEKDNFLESVLRLITTNGMEPHQLQLEITEREAVNPHQSVVPLLEQARDLGFKIALDDFGTGYNSLSYLNNLPASAIKIDRSFVTGMDRSNTGSKVISSIIELAQSVSLATITEGIETESQREKLLAMGCETAQGYLFSRPLSPDAIDGYLADSIGGIQ